MLWIPAWCPVPPVDASAPVRTRGYPSGNPVRGKRARGLVPAAERCWNAMLPFLLEIARSAALAAARREAPPASSGAKPVATFTVRSRPSLRHTSVAQDSSLPGIPGYRRNRSVGNR